MTRRPIAAEALLHPAALAAVAILVVNDHYLKQSGPGWVTGKLSDMAGMVYFPLFLQGVWEVAMNAARRPWRPSHRALVVAMVATGFVFGAVQLWGPAGELYRYGLGAVHGTIDALRTGVFQLRPVTLVQDPSDLIALPALFLAYLLGRTRCLPDKTRPQPSAKGDACGQAGPR